MAEPRSGPPRIAIGCFMVPLGTFSGAMVAVLVGKIVAYFIKAPACEGLPLCDWYKYAGVGALLGALSLPSLVLWRLRRTAPSDTIQRS
ncbi:MAG: hypothetical protein JO180_05245 [Gemmatirosa sp.]|nr:hypothetical protein [Gemmatirosa sp.]